MNLILISIIIFILNIPFGYWRANVKRFSVQWFLAIHIPVPFIILFRLFSGVGFEPITYIVFFSAFLLGQLTGIRIFERMKAKSALPLTSCLVMDIIKSRNLDK